MQGYASLPKLPDALLPSGAVTPERDADMDMPMSKSTEDLLKDLHLPPPPSRMNEEDELAELEDRLRRLDSNQGDGVHATPPRMPSPTPSTRSGASGNGMPNALQQLHANLEARLLPFWSSVLSARTIRLSLYASRADLPPTSSQSLVDPGRESEMYAPLQTTSVQTAVDGSFVHTFDVNWERMCTHPRAVHVAFGDPTVEHELVIVAELLAPSPSPPPPPPQGQLWQEIPGQPPRARARDGRREVSAEVVTPISLSHSPVRELYN